jgi:ABC-type Na+ efflux pump permease subunit
MIVLPGLVAIIVTLAMFSTASVNTEIVTMVVGTVGAERLPPRAIYAFLDLSPPAQEQMIGRVIKALTMPVFWIVTVALTATVASDSFVGEKERGTLEPLLATPISNGEIFFGKLLTAVVPATACTWLGTLILSIGAWQADNPFFPRMLLADSDWATSTFVIVPLMAVMSAGVAALISTRVATYRAAYQLNGLVVLPVVTLLIPQTMVLFFVTPWALYVLGAAFALIDVLLITTAVSFFDREHLLKGA